MIMFCGLPVIVAVLPTLEAIGIASRYGSGLRLSEMTSSATIGVMIRQMVSLTRNAEKKPHTSTTAMSSTSGCRARVMMKPFTSRKKPDSLRLATRIIMRSEEHTSELQSRENLVCRLLLEKKKQHEVMTIVDKKKKSYTDYITTPHAI